MTPEQLYKSAFIKTVKALTLPSFKALDFSKEPTNSETELLAYKEARQSLLDYMRALIDDSDRRAKNYARGLELLDHAAEAACDEPAEAAFD